MMTKKSSSRRWMNEHLNDEYVKKAQKEGYRCRAVYKLIEIIDNNQILQRVIGSLTLERHRGDGRKCQRK